MDEQTTLAPVVAGPELAVAGSFLDGLLTQDFAHLAASLAPDVHLRTLLPGGFREWSGAAAVADRFARWFGDTVRFEPIEHAVGQVGGRPQLRWRLRLQADRLGHGWFVVDQIAYADTDAHNRIARLDLLCSGYLPERSDG